MSSREKSKKAARELLALCAEEGVKVPTDPVNAAVEAGTMLSATREEGEFQLDAALKEMIKKFGLKKSPSPKKKKKESKDDVKTEKKIGRKRTSDHIIDKKEDVDDETKIKKPRKMAEATCKTNQNLADAFVELSGFEFKRGEKFKGGTWAKVAKAIRDCDSVLTCGQDALKLKGVGKSSAAKIDEFIETGTLQKLEEYRAGNM
ncbi:unnamed protein product [Peronospora destructor]|uniref:Crossover junction endonuclease MUS81-like HHH domain-containing protein n=1 Tax=Peronospora destructor TaxID=86335 RepID=A0AAV0U224_9STRA|nr:unnamed protein product [Peronospora destructor]